LSSLTPHETGVSTSAEEAKVATDNDDVAGNNRAVGFSILGMAAVAGALYIWVVANSIPLGFIDANGIAGIGATFVVVGGIMVYSGRSK
jgi:hypothetical protein